jgi:hypothetical protein
MRPGVQFNMYHTKYFIVKEYRSGDLLQFNYKLDKKIYWLGWQKGGVLCKKGQIPIISHIILVWVP